MTQCNQFTDKRSQGNINEATSNKHRGEFIEISIREEKFSVPHNTLVFQLQGGTPE